MQAALNYLVAGRREDPKIKPDIKNIIILIIKSAFDGPGDHVKKHDLCIVFDV